MPVNRLKLLAFCIGAGIAGFTGCMFATLLTAVTPGNFDVPILITIYAIVILGGFGSLSGVVLGAVVITVSFQFLAPENPQNNARVLFYTIILLASSWRVRPWWRLAARARRDGRVRVRGARDRRGRRAVLDGRRGVEAGRLGDLIGAWVIVPQGHPDFGNFAYVVLVVLVLALTQMRPSLRLVRHPVGRTSPPSSGRPASSCSRRSRAGSCSARSSSSS